MENLILVCVKAWFGVLFVCLFFWEVPTHGFVYAAAVDDMQTFLMQPLAQKSKTTSIS